MFKKFIATVSVIMALMIAFGSLTSFAAVDYGCKVKTVTDSILLVNMDKNTTVFEKNADQKRYPASTTKIMTYIIVSENVEDIKNTRVEVKQEVLDELSGTGSSLSGLSYHVGDKMTVWDLLHCLMVSSGNDAALVLGYYVGGGDMQTFVDMMNAKAKELGCENTNFVNPHGLHDNNHYTTARDMYKIATYALSLPYFAEITNTVTYYCEGDDYPLVTTNYLIDENRGGDYYYMYAQGIKTGTTNEAGRCLVTTAVADGYAYICILFHAPYDENAETQTNGAMIDAKELFRWALLNLELNPIITKTTPVCEQKINYAWNKDSIQLVPQDDVSEILPNDTKQEDITIEPSISEIVDTPIKQGDVLGTAKVLYKGQEIKKINLVADETVERSELLYTLEVIKNIATSYWFIIAMVLIIILFALYLFVTSLYNNRKKKNKNVKRYRKM